MEKIPINPWYRMCFIKFINEDFLGKQFNTVEFNKWLRLHFNCTPDEDYKFLVFGSNEEIVEFKLKVL